VKTQGCRTCGGRYLSVLLEGICAAHGYSAKLERNEHTSVERVPCAWIREPTRATIKLAAGMFSKAYAA
jgi:hypothetical protein